MFADDESDFTKFSNIHLRLSDAITKSLIPMVYGKLSITKLMQKEFNNEQAINPIFLKDFPKSENKKRKLDEAFPNLTDDQFEDQPCPVLDDLTKLYHKCAVKPNRASSLMATIITILNDMYRLESVHKDEETWPCNTAYGNNLVSLRRYLDRKLAQAKPNEENEAFVQFNFSLFEHKNEFLYLSISDISFANRVVRRISHKLVPDFDNKDRREELDKFFNISLWLTAIHTECLSVLTTDPQSISFTSFFSSGSASTASSTTCPSRDTDDTSQVIVEAGSSIAPITKGLNFSFN